MNTPNAIANEYLLALRFKEALATEDYLLCGEIAGIIARRLERGTLNLYTVVEPFRSFTTGRVDYAEYPGLFDQVQAAYPALYDDDVAPRWARLLMAGDAREATLLERLNPWSSDEMDYPSCMEDDLS